MQPPRQQWRGQANGGQHAPHSHAEAYPPLGGSGADRWGASHNGPLSAGRPPAARMQARPCHLPGTPGLARGAVEHCTLLCPDQSQPCGQQQLAAVAHSARAPATTGRCQEAGHLQPGCRRAPSVVCQAQLGLCGRVWSPAACFAMLTRLRSAASNNRTCLAAAVEVARAPATTGQCQEADHLQPGCRQTPSRLPPMA